MPAGIVSLMDDENVEESQFGDSCETCHSTCESCMCQVEKGD